MQTSPAAVIRPIDSHDLPAMAALQSRVIAWSFTGKLGREHILKLYRALFEHKLIFGYACIYEGRMIGFSVGTLHYAKTRQIVSRLYLPKLPTILWHSLRSPSVLLNIFESKFIVPREYKKTASTAEWLCLVTDIEDSSNYPLAALLLMRKTLQHFHEKGFNLVSGQAYAQQEDRPKREKLYALVKGKVTRRLWVNDIYVFRTEL